MWYSRINRRGIVAATVISMGVGGLCTINVFGQDHKLPKDPMSIAMSADEQKLASDHLNKLKEMANDPNRPTN